MLLVLNFKNITFGGMKKRWFVLFSLSSMVGVAQNAGELKTFNLFEDSLISICKKMYAPRTTDANKEKYNGELLTTFETALNTANSMDYGFDSLSILKYMSILVPSDKKCRIITWNLPKEDGTQEYYGFVQEKYLQTAKKGIFKKSKNEVIQLYSLTDKSAEIRNAENYISDNKKWFGMLYYKVIEKKWKGKTYYTLLAWDGNDKFSTKKISFALTA